MSGKGTNIIKAILFISVFKSKVIFFNEEGILNIDEMVVNNASFGNILEEWGTHRGGYQGL